MTYDDNGDVIPLSERFNDEKSDIRYSLESYSEAQILNWKASKKIVIYDGISSLRDFVSTAISDKGFVKKMYFGYVGEKLANAISNSTGYDLYGRNVALRADNVRKIQKDHGSSSELLRGQKPIDVSDYEHIIDVVGNPDSISKSEYNEKPAVEFSKSEQGLKRNVIMVDSGGSLDLFVQTMYINKKGSIAHMVNDKNVQGQTLKATVGTTSSNPRVTHSAEKINPNDKEDST